MVLSQLEHFLEAQRSKKKSIGYRGLIFCWRTSIGKVVTACGFLGDKHLFSSPHEAKESELTRNFVLAGAGVPVGRFRLV